MLDADAPSSVSLRELRRKSWSLSAVICRVINVAELYAYVMHDYYCVSSIECWPIYFLSSFFKSFREYFRSRSFATNDKCITTIYMHSPWRRMVMAYIHQWKWLCCNILFTLSSLEIYLKKHCDVCSKRFYLRRRIYEFRSPNVCEINFVCEI